ncbi:hypothetical protein PPSIR1_37084 [Plesiocystis pacifica SIR-1]|uniref:Uncharacterized protein n=1 Tax=Plesiocystis pacifica SIR-1 TaxID=391625 RepID=A6G0I2_9BACT|nr:hypothetical protein [Plesiocystis pacifica]EDM80628.1 hypothetical protein PPSIR1_37084 [Plesiocystis pacifica SIR-1]
MSTIELPPEPGAFPKSALFDGPYTAVPELPLGKWSVIANQRIYVLTIHGEKGGEVSAELNSGDVVDAKWDSKNQRLTFTRVVPNVVKQSWTGYVMAHDPDDPKMRMAGTFENIKPIVSPNASGWYATMNLEKK